MQDGGYPRRRGGQVRAHPGINRAADGSHLALGVGCHLHILHMVAPVGSGDIVLGAGFRPFHRNPQLHRAEGGNHLPGIDRDFRPEAAAHLRRDDPDLMLRHPGDQAGHEPRNVRVLRRVPQRQFPHCRRPGGNGRPGFHRRGNQLLLLNGFADHNGGLGKGGVGVPAGGHPVERLVAGRVLMQLRRPRAQRRLRVDDGRQRLVVHLNQFQRILRLVAVLRHHHGHRVAHIAHPVNGNGGVGNRLQIRVGDGPGAGNGVQNAGRVRPGIDGKHAGRAFGGVGIDAPDAGVSVGAAQNRRVDHSRQLDVVGVGGLPGNQARIFPPPDAGAEYAGRHNASSRLPGRLPAAELQRRPERPARCCCSRCSGTYSPPARRALPPPSGRGCAR